jgi:hypothetical protein
MKVCILGYDCESVLLSPIPDSAVVRLAKSDCPDVRRTGKQIGYVKNNPAGEIPIEEQLHAGATNSFRSRSAANAKQA